MDECCAPKVAHLLQQNPDRTLNASSSHRGLHKPAFRPGCTRRDGTKPSDDLVKRNFIADGPDRLWVIDMIEHPPAQARSTSPSSWTHGHGGSLAGRSLSICALTLSSTRSPWRHGGGGHQPAKRSRISPVLPERHGSVALERESTCRGRAHSQRPAPKTLGWKTLQE